MDIELTDDQILEWANEIIGKRWRSPVGRYIFKELEKLGYTEFNKMDWDGHTMELCVFTFKAREE